MVRNESVVVDEVVDTIDEDVNLPAGEEDAEGSTVVEDGSGLADVLDALVSIVLDLGSGAEDGGVGDADGRVVVAGGGASVVSMTVAENGDEVDVFVASGFDEDEEEVVVGLG